MSNLVCPTDNKHCNEILRAECQYTHSKHKYSNAWTNTTKHLPGLEHTQRTPLTSQDALPHLPGGARQGVRQAGARELREAVGVCDQLHPLSGLTQNLHDC